LEITYLFFCLLYQGNISVIWFCGIEWFQQRAKKHLDMHKWKIDGWIQICMTVKPHNTFEWIVLIDILGFCKTMCFNSIQISYKYFHKIFKLIYQKTRTIWTDPEWTYSILIEHIYFLSDQHTQQLLSAVIKKDWTPQNYTSSLKWATSSLTFPKVKSTKNSTHQLKNLMFLNPTRTRHT